MGILTDPDDERLCACGELADYECDGCGVTLCGECLVLTDLDCPNEFCDQCVRPFDFSNKGT